LEAFKVGELRFGVDDLAGGVDDPRVDWTHRVSRRFGSRPPIARATGLTKGGVAGVLTVALRSTCAAQSPVNDANAPSAAKRVVTQLRSEGLRRPGRDRRPEQGSSRLMGPDAPVAS
jgi:hypothetical protein